MGIKHAALEIVLHNDNNVFHEETCMFLLTSEVYFDFESLPHMIKFFLLFK